MTPVASVRSALCQPSGGSDEPRPVERRSFVEIDPKLALINRHLVDLRRRGGLHRMRSPDRYGFHDPVTGDRVARITIEATPVHPQPHVETEHG